MDEVDVSVEELKKLFEEYNQKFFDGKLPHFDVRLSRGKSKLDKRRKIIFIKRDESEDKLENVLFEMMMEIEMSFEEN